MRTWRLCVLMVAGCGALPAYGDTLPGMAQAARALLGPDQGVYVQATDGSVLVAQAAARAVHPASVSKVPTTLALLRRFGPDYRFATRFAAAGPVQMGTLQGDLIVQASADPSMVDEDALLVASRLQALGIGRITGRLQVRGTLTFDWQPDPDGAHLARALSGQVPSAAWESVRVLFPGDAASALTPPGVSFLMQAPAIEPAVALAQPSLPRTLLVYRSEPLLSLLKALNDYSNNIFTPLADAAGGAGAVQALARSLVPTSMRAEITLGDGAGTDPRNRLSPRAAVTLLRALDQQLSLSSHALSDILPVAGVDEGTLHDRLNAPEERGRVVGKTGTFGSYGASALVGAIHTGDRGTVYFAILNHGIPVPEARRRQDRFVQALLRRLHSVPWSYQRDARPAVARAELTGAPS